MQINYDDCREIESKITDRVVEAVAGYETIRMYSLGEWWLQRMAALFMPTVKPLENGQSKEFRMQDPQFRSMRWQSPNSGRPRPREVTDALPPRLRLTRVLCVHELEEPRFGGAKDDREDREYRICRHKNVEQ